MVTGTTEMKLGDKRKWKFQVEGNKARIEALQWQPQGQNPATLCLAQPNLLPRELGRESSPRKWCRQEGKERALRRGHALTQMTNTHTNFNIMMGQLPTPARQAW
jgi:hypothetical protein